MFPLRQQQDWKKDCEFVREHFLGPERDIAVELAAKLAGLVGARISRLTPETILSEVLCVRDRRILLSDFYDAEKYMKQLKEGRLDSLDKVELVMMVEDNFESKPTWSEKDVLTYLEKRQVVTFRDWVRAVHRRRDSAW